MTYTKTFIDVPSTSATQRLDQITNPAAIVSLNIPAGNEITLTFNSTTQTGFKWTSSSITSGILANLDMTGTAAIASAANSGSLLAITSSATGFTAATQRLVSIRSSGVLANASVTMVGLYISPDNTGTTPTWIALQLAPGNTASGSIKPGTVANYSILHSQGVQAGGTGLSVTSLLLSTVAFGAGYSQVTVGGPMSGADVSTGDVLTANIGSPPALTAKMTAGGFLVTGWGGGANGPPQINIYKTRGAIQTINSTGIIVSGDILGAINFSGDDTLSNWPTGARIVVTSEGTIGTNRIPSRIGFWTSTDAAPGVLTEVLRLSSAQQVMIGSSQQTVFNSSGLLTKYNNISTAGQGVPWIPGVDNRSGLAVADGAATTVYAVPAGAGQLYRITADIFATAYTSGTATYTITWTENAGTRTLVVTAAALNTLGTATDLINPDASTNITAQLTGTFTATVTVAGVVERVA